MSTPIINPNAPIALNGVSGDDELCDLADATIIFPGQGSNSAITAGGLLTLTASQILTTYRLRLSDVPFDWHGLEIYSEEDEGFGVRLTDETGLYFSDFTVWSRNLPGRKAAPFPIFPYVPLPANYVIRVDLKNFSTSTNNIQLGLRGIKRYRKVYSPWVA